MARALASCSFPVFRPLSTAALKPLSGLGFGRGPRIRQRGRETNLFDLVSKDFKPPDPKPFSVRPDKGGYVFGASLALFFHFGTGFFAQGGNRDHDKRDERNPGSSSDGDGDGDLLHNYGKFAPSSFLFTTGYGHG